MYLCEFVILRRIDKFVTYYDDLLRVSYVWNAMYILSALVCTVYVCDFVILRRIDKFVTYYDDLLCVSSVWNAPYILCALRLYVCEFVIHECKKREAEGEGKSNSE